MVVYKVKLRAHRHVLLCHIAMHVILLHDINACHTVARDRPIMLIIFIMLCCSAQIFDLLCSILCSCKRIVLKNLTVLLEYIYLHQKF